MIRTALYTPLALLCLALVVPAGASIIHHAPLEQVLGQADWVVVGTVTAVEVREDNVHKLYTWTIRQERTLHGEAPPQDLPMSYSHRWPVMHDDQGRIIGTISPIYDGSGLEHDVRQDQTWILMGKTPGEGAKVVFVDRVEPLELEAQIAVLLESRSAIGTSAEAAVEHYLASRVRGDRQFEQVLPEPAQRSERLKRQLQEHDGWRFRSFRIEGRQDAGDGDVWIKVWMEIEFGGDVETGTDEFTVRKVGATWVVVGVPT